MSKDVADYSNERQVQLRVQVDAIPTIENMIAMGAEALHHQGMVEETKEVVAWIQTARRCMAAKKIFKGNKDAYDGWCRSTYPGKQHPQWTQRRVRAYKEFGATPLDVLPLSTVLALVNAGPHLQAIVMDRLWRGIGTTEAWVKRKRGMARVASSKTPRDYLVRAANAVQDLSEVLPHDYPARHDLDSMQATFSAMEPGISEL